MMNSIHLKRIIFLLFAGLMLPLTAAGQAMEGRVSDAETGLAIEGAMVSVTRNGLTIDYTLTDREGRYSLPARYKDSIDLGASYLGYRRETLRTVGAGRHDFALKMENIVLKEVEIRPGRIFGRRDTVRYDLTKFASERDQRISDVLKRLPGIDVKEDGVVTYQGKPIDRFMVEGMDLTGGRYNQLTHSLNAKAVKSVELMENYQSKKVLKERIPTDKVALNLRLDPKARDQWLLNGTAGIGLREENEGAKQAVTWDAGLNALQLGRGRQTLYNYKTNNTGTELSHEQRLLTSDGAEAGTDVPGYLTQPGFSAPLDTRRTLFNESHTGNANHMLRRPGDRTLRLQADYTHDRREQQRSTTSEYYLPGDTLRQTENQHRTRRTDAAHIEAQWEDNNERYYLMNRTRVEASRTIGTAFEAGQRMETTEVKAVNHFNRLTNRGNHTWQVQSTVQAGYRPERLYLTTDEEKSKVESLTNRQLYTDQTASYLRKQGDFTQQYRGGVEAEWQRFSHASLYLSAYYAWQRGGWKASLDLPVSGKRWFTAHRNTLLYRPSLHLQYEPTHRWRLSLYLQTRNHGGEAAQLYTSPLRLDYRTWQQNEGILAESTSQTAQLYGEYKNTLQEFFATLHLYYRHEKRQTLQEQQVTGDTLRYITRRLPHHTEQWQAKAVVSKGVYDWNLKGYLELYLGRNSGHQLTSTGQETALLQAYRHDYVKAEPKLTWLPATWIEAEYHGTLTYGRTRIGDAGSLTSLSDQVHRLNLTLTLGRIDMRLRGAYYRNQLSEETHLNTLLADAGLMYRGKRWSLEANLTNLFNKKEYGYTTLSTTQRHTSRLGIRPREVQVCARWQF